MTNRSLTHAAALLLTCTLSSTAGAQAYKDSIRAQFTRYTDHLMNKDVKSAMNYMNPKIYSFVPKAQLLQALEGMFETPEVSITFEKAGINSVGDKKVLGGRNYAKLSYTSIMLMRLKNGAGADTAAMQAALESRFGADKVTYTEGAYRISSTKNVIAESANGKTWTFLVDEARQRPMLEKILPKEIL